MDDQEKEKKNKRIGFLISLGIHSAIFIILFFLMAWRAPDPPLPEFGVELNFGMDDQGSGEVQPETPVGSDTDQIDETQDKPAESQPEEVKQEVKEDIKDEKAIEKAVSDEPSPVVVKEEKKKEVKKEIVKDKPVEKPKETVIAEYKKEVKKDPSTSDASKKGKEGNQGDDKDKVGDKGSEEGTLEAKALYGNQGGGNGGGGNGFGLSMAGWKWASDPKRPELPDNENGKVVFEIECDENGDITSIKTLERSLSPKAEQILKDEIRNNSLERTSGGRAPERSKGKIIFILKTK
ncbi:MAG: cell envelope integrity protein TolA [Cyclobacteriaceae bacterium]|nr:cell envelope integrity protein TolA [Cyclobacteriaceae bacterium]